MKYLTEEKLKDFRDKFGDLFHYINMVDWIESEINEAVTKAIPMQLPVGVPKPNTTCENCGHWRSENLECRKDIIWLNKDKNVFFNISDLKTGINFYCSNHTQFEQREA